MADQTRLHQLFARALACVEQRDYQQAALLYQRATEVDPDSFAAWCNLAAIRLELRETAEATAAARQAIALKPDFGPAWANLGDALRLTRGQADTSFDAYRRAAALMPDSAEVLNKLGASLQLRGRFPEAAATLQRALALAPGYRDARVNLVTTLMAMQRAEAARDLLLQGTQLPGQRPEFLDVWRGALELLEENLRLRPVLERALAQDDPAPVLAATAQARSERPVDEALVETIRRALQGSGEISHRFPPWRPELADTWYAVEAHFSAHLGETVEAVAATRRLLAGAAAQQPAETGETLGAKEQNALRYYQLCQRSRPAGGLEPVVADGWLRFVHGCRTGHRPETTPGQFKIVPNSVTLNPAVIRTPPAQVSGTLNAIRQLCRERAEPGPVRAAAVYFAVADIHPFPDGNGRLGRWLMNDELQTAGLAPVVSPDSSKPAFGQALWAIRRDRDFGPFVTWLADCAAYTQELVSHLDSR